MQQAMPVFTRLQNVMNNLNFYTHKKGLAIFVSPAFEKVLYLDFAVENNVHIDRDFKLLDVALDSKEEIEYLVVSLQPSKMCVYVGNNDGLQLLKENKRDRVSQLSILPQRTYPYSYLPYHFVDEYLLQLDQGLSLVLASYPYPVFVVGEESMTQRFLATTCNRHAIVASGFLPASRLGKERLLAYIQPHLDNWQQIVYDHLMHKIERAKVENKLAWGSRSIWMTGIKQGALLVAERNCKYPDRRFGKNDNLYNLPVAFNHAFYLTDAADEVAEKLLETGGKIQLVEKGSLSQYAHIAMVSN